MRQDLVSVNIILIMGEISEMFAVVRIKSIIAVIIFFLLIVPGVRADNVSSITFALRELPFFVTDSLDDALIGGFTSQGCGEVLAKRKDGVILVGNTTQSERIVQGLPASFPLQDALAIDLDNDGKTDLVEYLASEQRWWVARSLGEGNFQSASYTFADWVPDPRYPIASGNDGGTMLFVNSGNNRITLRFSLEKGLFVASTHLRDSNKVVVGGFVGKQDRKSFDRRSIEILHASDIPGILVRLNESEFITWAEFPHPITAEAVLFGDFNGDGFTDALAPGWNLGKWWIAVGGASTALEYPADAMDSLQKSVKGLTVGDLDCDGSDEIVQRKSSAGKIRAMFMEKRQSGVPQQQSGRALTDTDGPYVCVGYLPDSTSRKWGYAMDCPIGYALISSTLNPHFMEGSCCRLPAADILTDKQFNVNGRCPEGSIATGFRRGEEIRCTEINKERYRLRREEPGVHWGFGTLQSRESKTVEKAGVPIAFRHALGRRQFQAWFEEGCVGFPWGSLLVSTSPVSCSESGYRLLEYLGAAGDPPAGTAVRIFPDCRGEVNPFEPNAGCDLRGQ